MINQNFSDGGDKAETHKILNNFSSRVDSIPIAIELLQRSFPSIYHINFGFESMRLIFERRGPLMSFDQLFQCFNFIINLLTEQIDFFSSNDHIALRTSGCYTAAIAFRLIFEQEQMDTINQILEQTQNLLEQTGNHAILSFTLFAQYVEAMNLNYHHMDLNNQNKMQKTFKEDYIMQIISTAMKALSVRSSDGDANFIAVDKKVKTSALVLIKTCFSVFEMKNVENSFQLIKLPDSFRGLYATPESLDVFFGLLEIDDENLHTELFSVFDYLFRPQDTIWPSSAELLQFLVFAMERMKELIVNIQYDSKFLNQISRSVAHICFRAKKGENAIEIDQNWMEFADACGTFTTNVLQGSIDNYTNLFQIWQNIAQWNIREEIESTFSELLYNVLQAIISAVFQQIENDPSMMEDKIKEFDAKDVKVLWEISRLCHNAFGEYISTQFGAKIAESVSQNSSPAILLQLAYLLKICQYRDAGTKILKRDNKKSNFSYVENMLLQRISQFVNDTIENVQTFAETFGMPAVILEASFAKYTEIYFERILGVIRSRSIEPDKIALLELFLARLAADLQLFNQTSECSDLLVEILSVLQKIAENTETKQLLAQNEIIVSLYNRTIEVDFSELDETAFEKAHIKLYEVYASLVSTRKEFLEFLTPFDERVQVLDNNVDEDLSKETIALYRDLKGVVKGINKNSLFSSLFIEWFCDNKVEPTVGLITQYAEAPAVVRSIVKLWVSLYKNFKRSLSDSGVGIILFRSSSSIVNGIYQNCVEDSSQLQYLTQVIKFSLTTGTANFAVMKHFGDNSIDEILSSFYEILKLPFSDLSLNTKLCQEILTICKFLANECAQDLFTDGNSENRANILKFTANMLSNPIFWQKEFWNDAWNIVSSMLISTTKAVPSEIPLFRSHFVFILDGIMNINDNFTYDSCTIIDLMYQYDQAFVNEAFNALIQMYDPQFQQAITQVLTALVDQSATTPQSSNIRIRALNFQHAIKMYPTSLIQSEYFAQFYQIE